MTTDAWRLDLDLLSLFSYLILASGILEREGKTASLVFFFHLRPHIGLSLHGGVTVLSLEFLREVSTYQPTTISIPGFLRGGPRRQRQRQRRYST